MASVAVPTNLPHLPAPDTANPQELTRAPPAGQPHFDSLVNTLSPSLFCRAKRVPGQYPRVLPP